MENRPNQTEEKGDIFNLVADTIMKWYEQTFTTFTIAKPERRGTDIELSGILLVAKKQTLGALTTLANKHILPTHALLRTLVETYIVLVWALSNLPNDKKPTSDEVYKKLRRWDYTRLKKDEKFLEDLSQTPKIESAIGKVKGDIEKLQKKGIKELPNCKQLFRSLGGGDPKKEKECDELYARLYRRYSRAVHLNRNVSQQLVWKQDESEKPKLLYKYDIEPDGNELFIMASISCDINKAVRGFYGWQSDAIQNECEQLKSKLAG